MSVNAATLAIEIQVDDRGSLKVRQLGQEVEKTGAKGRQSFGVMDRTLGAFNKTASGAVAGVRRVVSAVVSIKGAAVAAGAAIAAIGVGWLSSQFLDAASTAEDYRIRLNRLLGSVEEGNRLFSLMSEYAGNVPFEYREVMGAATQLAGVLDGGAEAVAAWMPLIGDLAAVSGLSITEATDQVTRMMSAGAASADLFRERGILAMLGFQAGVSYSAQETRDQLIQAWTDAESKFRGTTADLATAWKGIKSMFSDLWFSFRNMVMDSGLFEFIKQGFSAILDRVAVLKKEGKLLDVAQALSSGVISGIIMMTKMLWAAHDAWNALRVAGAWCWKITMEGLTLAYNGLRQLLAPLDLIYRGMVKIGLLDVNPLDQLGEGLQDMTSDVDGFYQRSLVNIAATHDAYKGVVQELETWQRALTDAAEQQAETSALAVDAQNALTAQIGISMQEQESQEKESLSKRLATYDDFQSAVRAGLDKRVAAEKDAAGEVSSAWADATGGGQSGGAGGPLGLSLAISQMLDSQAMAAEWRLERAREEAETVAQAAADAEYEAAKAAYDAAVANARQWGAVASSYQSLLDGLAPYQSDMTLAQVQDGFGAALASVEAAEEFLKDLQYHAGILSDLKSGYESLIDSIAGTITAREREDWGTADWWAEYERLADEIAGLNESSESYYSDYLDLAEQMYDVLASIDTGVAQVRDGLVGVVGTTGSALTSLLGSDLNPAQSLEWYLAQYQTLFNRASSSLDSGDVSDFLSFAQQSYLPYLEAYGGDYQGIFDSAVADIQALQDAAGYDALSGFSSLAEALQETGEFATWLAGKLASDPDSLTDALGGVGDEASVTGSGMQAVVAQLEALSTSTEVNLTYVAEQLTSLVSGIAAAVAALESNANVTITMPTASPTASYDYNWSFVTTSTGTTLYQGINWAWGSGYWTTPHGGHVGDKYDNNPSHPATTSKPSYGYVYYAADGAIATGRAPLSTVYGEAGVAEAYVPMTEQHVSQFARGLGFKPEEFKTAVRDGVSEALGQLAASGGSSGPRDLVLQMDKREVARLVGAELATDREFMRIIARRTS